MTRRLGFWVRLKEMVQNVEQSQHMLSIARELSMPDIVDDHAPDPIDTVFLA